MNTTSKPTTASATNPTTASATKTTTETTTIPALLRARVAAAPEAPAVIGRIGGAWTTLTYRELDEHSDRVAVGLAQRGIGSGTPVSWGLDNSVGAEALVLHLALMKLAAVSVPLNTRLVAPEVAGMLAQTESVLLIADRALADKWASLRIEALWRSDDMGNDVVSLLGADGRLVGPGPESEDLACVLYTSGTTGLPKGVEHTHRSSLAASFGWADALGLTVGERIQSPFPVFSGAGLHYNALAAFCAGASCIVDEPDVEGCLTRIGTYRSTVYTAVPSIFQYWLDRPDLAAFDLTSVRLLAFGGSAMAASVIQRLQAAIPTAALMHTYGLTEGGPSGTYLPSEFTMTKLGSIGDRTPRSFNRYRVVDDQGRDVAPGVLGELVLAGPSVMRGYHRDPAATASVFFGEWLRSGDRVRLDADGFLFYEGRIKDLVVRGGYNISPLEVERVLLEHPAILDAAVYGLPHARLGEEVAAALVAATGCTIDVEDVTAHCAVRLSDIKIPRRIQLVDELPRNAAGKVLKRELAARHPSHAPQGELHDDRH